MLKNIKKEELEILSYSDLAELILKEEAKTYNTPELFRLICNLLEDESIYEDKIGDFYTSLATDKRFVFLDNNEWDLREKNPVDIVMDEEDDIEEESLEEEVEDEELDTEEDIESSIEDDDLDDVEEDLEDLAILSDEELEEE